MDTKPVSAHMLADTKRFDEAMHNLTKTTHEFGGVFSSTLTNAVKSGKGLEDILKQVGRRLSDLALQRAVGSLDSILSGMFGGVSSTSNGSGKGLLGSVVPFARGGVVSSPTLFGLGSGLGVMGEAGSEAILPLRRGSDGSLGVSASKAQQPVSVIFNIQTNDVESFKRSESQLTSMLARAVSRGNRNL